MPRLNVVDPAHATGHLKQLFDGPLAGKHINIFKGMANSPAALEAYLGLAGALENAALTFKEREVIQLAVGAANNCDYCQAAHTALGKKAGLTEAQTLEARRGSIASDPRLDALARFTLTLHEKKGFINDQDLASFKAAGYTDGHVAEVIAAYALAIYTNTFNHVNQTNVDFPTPPPL